MPLGTTWRAYSRSSWKQPARSRPGLRSFSSTISRTTIMWTIEIVFAV